MATAKEKKEEVKASLKILRAELRKMHLESQRKEVYPCNRCIAV